MTTLSIIILSYNTKDITQKAIQALVESTRNSKAIQFEIIVVDNASSDDSVPMLHLLKESIARDNITVTVIENTENTGFPKGNNQGVRASRGEYILFLNSDVIVGDIQWESVLNYLHTTPNCGALTVRVELPAGTIDPASHRGFPTVWNAFCYYSRLEKMTKSIPFLNRIFGGYHLTYLDLDSIHEIDSPSGAFYLTKRHLFDQVGGFDETFFMYGEDLDLSFKLKEKGYKIIYDPTYTVMHMKYQSGLKTKTADTKRKTKKYFYDAMNIFYKKHYEQKYPAFVNSIVYSLIDFKAKL